jgi:hypothetical protein
MIRTPTDSNKPEIKFNSLPINDMKDKTLADVTTWGNQPEGEVKLTYYCEKRTQQATATINDVNITLTEPLLSVSSMVLYSNQYKRVKTVSGDKLSGTLESQFTGSVGSGLSVTIGEFYSDPNNGN